MKKTNLIENYIKDITELCKTHKVKSLYAFGSVLTDKFNNESDIDLIVDFKQLDVLDYGDNYYDLKFSLQKMFQLKEDFSFYDFFGHFCQRLVAWRQLGIWLAKYIN